MGRARAARDAGCAAEGAQGMMVAEMWMDRIARTVGRSPEEVRALNMYREGDKTHYGQVLDGCQLRPCWDHVRSFHMPPCTPCPSPTHQIPSTARPFCPMAWQ